MSATSLTLISHPLCPFVQRAAIVLLEKRVPFTRTEVDLADKPDWFLALSAGPYFGEASFGMVDAVFAPLFRYFDIIPSAVAQPIFAGLPRVSAWRATLAARQSVIAAVGSDYPERFRRHLREHQALLADGH